MTHPADDLLAPYVDGSLPERDRAAVDAHLATCARCTRDVAQAASARAALRALPEIAIPEDLVIPGAGDAEAGAASAHRRSTAPAWQRWAGPAAAVAAAALVVTLVLPKLGGGSEADLASPAAADNRTGQAGVQVDAAAVPLEIRDTDYDDAGIAALVEDTAARVTAPEATTGVPGASSASGATVPKVGTPVAAATANACIQKAFHEVDGTPVRLIKANFQGEPAYVGFYAEGPGAGQPADTLVVLVAAVDGCTVLSSAGQAL